MDRPSPRVLTQGFPVRDIPSSPKRLSGIPRAGNREAFGGPFSVRGVGSERKGEAPICRSRRSSAWHGRRSVLSFELCDEADRI